MHLLTACLKTARPFIFPADSCANSVASGLTCLRVSFLLKKTSSFHAAGFYTPESRGVSVLHSLRVCACVTFCFTYS